MRHCRFCSAPLSHTFADLGASPVANAFLKADELNRMEPYYPLHVYVCERCLLVQLEDFETPDHIFNDQYAYFSSFSDSWLAHARQYCEAMTARLGLTAKSLVVEIASNDGYLLQNFVKAGIPCLGVEPSGNTAAAARTKGVETWELFFSTKTAHDLVAKRGKADLILGNNVLAHVPPLNDFVAGLKIALAENGVITMEFPHLLRLMQENQFDTIYHEHYSYFSFLTVEKVFAAHGLRLFKVDQLGTHGGSLRIYGAHADCARHPSEPCVAALKAQESAAGLARIEGYAGFSQQMIQTKRNLLRFLIETKNAGRTIVGYGAPAKGNTLLNYCGVRTDFIDYTVDRSPHKQGTFLPGSRIPVLAPEAIFQTKPDFVLILPWNLREEIAAQLAGISAWGGQFVVPIPQVEVFG